MPSFLNMNSHTTAMDLAKEELAEALYEAIVALFQNEDKGVHLYAREICEDKK